MNKMRYLRIGLASVILLIIFACTFAHVPIGTLCALCPVGFAELWAASGSVPLDLLPGVLILLAVIFLLGRVFCSWVCPTSWLRNIFGGSKPHGLTGQTGICAGCAAQCSSPKTSKQMEQAETDQTETSERRAKAVGVAEAADAAEVAKAPEVAGVTETATTQADEGGAVANPNRFRLRNNLAAQSIVLAVLLIISFLVHFPVFCLFCPIGLVFGTMFAISRLFVTWQPGWELVVFPVMLALELFVLRKWCSAICPLGFFFGLMAKARARITALPRVRVNQQTCIHAEGCQVCSTTCPENICAATANATDEEDCTLCGDCVEHCPSRAIKL